MAVELLTEFVDNRSQSLRVDRDKGVIAGVKIIGEHSANNRRYLSEALTKAIPLYEGSKVNVNHKPRPGEPRDYQERLGFVRNVRSGNGGLYADLHYNPKHALAEQLAWDAENSPEAVGFSPVHQGKVTRQNGQTIVEAIVSVQSVDLVADPATTKSLFEHLDPEGDDMSVDLSKLTLEQLRESRPDLLETIRADKQHDDELVKAKAESKRLQEQIAALEAKEQKAKLAESVDALLKEHKVPEFARTDAFRSCLLGAADDEARVALIKDRLELIGEQAKPKSRERQAESFSESRSAAPQVSNGKEFASAIRG